MLPRLPAALSRQEASPLSAEAAVGGTEKYVPAHPTFLSLGKAGWWEICGTICGTSHLPSFLIDSLTLSPKNAISGCGWILDMDHRFGWGIGWLVRTRKNNVGHLTFCSCVDTLTVSLYPNNSEMNSRFFGCQEICGICGTGVVRGLKLCISF